MAKEPRRRFSERMGLVEVVAQTEGMDDALRNSLWNFARSIMLRAATELVLYHQTQALAARVLRLPVDNVSYVYPLGWLKNEFLKAKWPTVYELLEYIVAEAPEISGGRVTTEEAVRDANEVLQREHSGFRFIAGELTRIMSTVEGTAVEEAIANARRVGLHGPHQHIAQALALFGKRPQPDFRNAIKEAISAIESAVKLIEGVKSGGLERALDALARKAEIHGAFKAGLASLYGFTSDASGIRHPLLEASNLSEEDARFMIVTCSAAVNWIITKAEKAGLLRASA